MSRPDPGTLDPSRYKIELRLRIDWSEMDVFGHVNNVMFMKYVQASRVNLWQHTGLGDRVGKGGTGPMLASTACHFLKPLFYPGNVVVRARVSFIKTTSFGIEHIILNEQGVPVALASDVVVNYDFGREEKLPIPDTLRARLTELC